MIILKSLLSLFVSIGVHWWLTYLFLTTESFGQNIYVSTSDPNQLTVYSLNKESGQLTEGDPIPTNGPPGCFCFNETGDRLYVSLRQVGKISAFSVDDKGNTRLLNEASTEAYPGYVRVHDSGKYLFCSYYQAGQVTVYRIHDDGTLSEEPIQTIKTDANAHAVVTDQEGQFLYVPHTRPNKIFQFEIDADSGMLRSTTPSFLQRGTNTGPRHLWFHPTLDMAYGSDEQGSSITRYSQNSSDGTLTTVETLSSLPAHYTDGNSTADIEVHPSGQFVYIANRGHNSVASFAIDQKDGSLSFLEHTPVEPVPRSFNITPDGEFLIAAGQQSGKLRVFRIDASGRLDHTQTVEAEGSPWWVVSRPTQ